MFMPLCYFLCQDFDQQPEASLRNSIAVIAAPTLYKLIYTHIASSVYARIAFLS